MCFPPPPNIMALSKKSRNVFERDHVPEHCDTVASLLGLVWMIHLSSPRTAHSSVEYFMVFTVAVEKWRCITVESVRLLQVNLRQIAKFILIGNEMNSIVSPLAVFDGCEMSADWSQSSSLIVHWVNPCVHSVIRLKYLLWKLRINCVQYFVHCQ